MAGPAQFGTFIHSNGQISTPAMKTFAAISIGTNLFNKLTRPVTFFCASVHYHHPSWKSNRPVEYWCYDNEEAVSKLIPLKDLKSEISEGVLEKKFSSQGGLNNLNRWLLFSGRDDATATAVLEAFNVSLPARNVDVSQRAKVDYVLGTTRSTDHLLLRVQDLRLQQHEHDGDDGDVDDIAWLQVSTKVAVALLPNQ